MGTFLTLGTFDGVHRGHQALLKTLRRQAARHGCQSLVILFPYPPRHLLRSNLRRTPALLSEVPERIQKIRSFRIDRIHLLYFNRHLAAQTPRVFFQRQLLRKFRMRGMLVGKNFAFGRNRRGTLPILRGLCRQAKVILKTVRLTRSGARRMSSTRIRDLLHRGKLEAANRLLGEFYCVPGKRVSGKGLGRKIGFPTLNLRPPKNRLLPPGVFLVRALWKGGSGFGLCNVGHRPTLQSSARTQGPLSFEVHLLRAPGGSHARHTSQAPRRLRIFFLKRLRSERRFPSLRHLQLQLQKDRRTALKVLAVRTWRRACLTAPRQSHTI
ncbi:MAG: riboflavin biosynthesis protein RibF [Elusimicrobia bacterium]|nr:riboflavin biosynthesis protein RibF [Elusimicrobiota bacterium]